MTSTEIAICNRALSLVGIGHQISDVDGTLANSTESSTEKRACDLWYPQCRDQLFEAMDWTFARKRASLVLADDGTGEVWIDEWENAFVYPSDCAQLRHFVRDIEGKYYRTPYGNQPYVWDQSWTWRFEVGQHAGAKVIFSDVDQVDADMVYTRLETDTTLFTSMFVDGLQWLLASYIAIPLSVNEQTARSMRQMYEVLVQRAWANMLNEGRPRDEPDGEFLRARGGD